MSALSTRQTSDRDGEEMLLQLFLFYGGARVAAEMADHHEIARAQIVEVLRELDVQAGRTQTAVDRTRTYADLRQSWSDSRAALSVLLQRYTGQAPLPAPTTPAKTEPPPAEPPKPEPPKPEGLRAEISETQWAGTFLPDLILRGTFEGRILDTVELVVRDSNDKEVYRDTTRLQGVLDKSLEGKDRNALQKVSWELRINDDKLADGANRIVVTLKDKKGAKVEGEISVRKKLF